MIPTIVQQGERLKYIVTSQNPNFNMEEDDFYLEIIYGMRQQKKVIPKSEFLYGTGGEFVLMFDTDGMIGKITARMVWQCHDTDSAPQDLRQEVDEQVIAFTKEKGLLSIPGAYTPTEIMRAYQLGADVVKIFPILPDGEAYLKNVVSPLSHIPFMVTGGINPNTVEKFLAIGATALAAGVTIVTPELADSGDFDTIRENARRHTEKIHS